MVKEDIVDIAKSIKPYGGIVAINLRNSSGEITSTGNPSLVNSLKEAIEIGRLSGVPIEISSLELKAPWKNLNYAQLNSVMRAARQEGLDITADQAPYDADFDALTRFLPTDYVTNNSIKKEYMTAEGKSKIISEIENLFSSLGPDKFLIVSYPANKFYEGKTLRQIATFEGKKPAQCYWEMATMNPPPMVAVSDSSDRFAKKIMASPIVFTASEGITYVRGSALTHPSYWGAFPRKLRKYVLEDKIVHLNDAIRSMTSLPAEKFKLKGRGQIAVGNFADIAIIDLQKIKDKATFVQPEQNAEGVEYLIINGIVSVEKGKVTGKKGGKAQKRI
jgi:N-acyl-D-amino-acid deacylase